MAHLAAAAALTTTACSSASDDAPREEAEPPAASTAPESAAGTAECIDPEPNETGFHELRGLASEGELWALLFGNYPARQGQEIKIAWRMTGNGPLSLSATGPTGSIVTQLLAPTLI